MKWAPNKKLHFEIALIKAIQSLGQTTLTEVIDALTVLREGEPATVSSRSAATAPPRPPLREKPSLPPRRAWIGVA